MNAELIASDLKLRQYPQFPYRVQPAQSLAIVTLSCASGQPSTCSGA
jgi:hypothetical protein